MFLGSRANPRNHERSVEYHRDVGSGDEGRGRAVFRRCGGRSGGDARDEGRRAHRARTEGVRRPPPPRIAQRSARHQDGADRGRVEGRGGDRPRADPRRRPAQARPGDAAKEARYIETVPTRGYRFIADVRDAPSTEADANDPPAPPLPALAALRPPRGSSVQSQVAMACGSRWSRARRGDHAAPAPGCGPARDLSNATGAWRPVSRAS